MFTTRQSAPLSWSGSAAIAGAWLALALPLIRLGYGSDVDSWLVALRAGSIWRTGLYARSRSTGFPLYELGVTPFVALGGWVASNAVSLVCGLALLLVLRQMSVERQLRHPSFTAVLFLFLPVFLENATSTIDYVPGLAVLAAAYLCLVTSRATLCAVLVGVACGLRPTNGLFIVPVAAAQFLEGRRAWPAARLVLIAVAVAIVVMLPSLRLGGVHIAFVTGPLNGILNGMRLLGIAQTVVFVAIAATAAWQARRQLTAQPERAFVAFHAINAAVWLCLFAVFPGEADYLFPVLLSVVLVLDRFATRRVLALCAVVLWSYHVVALEVLGSRGGQRPVSIRLVPGLTLRDVGDRRFKLWLRDATSTVQPERPLLVMEQILPPVVGNDAFAYDEANDVYTRTDGRVSVSQPILDIDELRTLRAQGVRVVTWRENEWQYRLPGTRAAHELVEFIDDPGALLGTPVRGRPADLPPTIP